MCFVFFFNESQYFLLKTNIKVKYIFSLQNETVVFEYQRNEDVKPQEAIQSRASILTTFWPINLCYNQNRPAFLLNDNSLLAIDSVDYFTKYY